MRVAVATGGGVDLKGYITVKSETLTVAKTPIPETNPATRARKENRCAQKAAGRFYTEKRPRAPWAAGNRAMGGHRASKSPLVS